MGAKHNRGFRKGCAAALCIVCGALAFWSSILLVSRWDDLWSAGDFYQSGSLYSALWPYRATVEQGMMLRLRETWGQDLEYLEELQLQQIEKKLRAEQTNYRFRVRLDDGTILWSNLDQEQTLDDLARQDTYSFTVTQGDELYNEDQSRWDSTDSYEILQVWTGEKYVEFSPVVPADAAGAGQYGYSYDTDMERWIWTEDQDSRVHTASLVVESGVTDPLTVRDSIWTAKENYDGIQNWLGPVTVLCLISLTLTLVGLVWLWRSIAFCSEESQMLPLSWQDRIPYELYLLGASFLFCIPQAAGDPITTNINQHGLSLRAVIGLGVLTMAEVGLVLAALMSTMKRWKNGILLRNTLCWHLCARVGHFFREVMLHWPITRRAVWIFLLYLVGTVLTGATIILIPVYQGLVLWGICRWVRQWKEIRSAAEEIVSGGSEVQIDTRGMYRDLKEHAQQLNALGVSITHAVEERLRSERFKAELITNVSHDLKTPLTSIINYVDLLKKVGITEPKALEYLEVLDRKSQRLKKLTEDLVEASKASTGTLPVSLERLDFGQLVQQAMGEYEEKFAQAGLTPVLDQGDGSRVILADGRHLWRVIDNLLGNCCKYALSGTRVYLDLSARDGRVFLTVKNISRAALNLPPEQLMERFVRGDTARSTEGSGLGLSIARSLTELQGGSFRLDIDGDLFKAEVSLPAAPEEPLSPPEQSGESEMLL